MDDLFPCYLDRYISFSTSQLVMEDYQPSLGYPVPMFAQSRSSETFWMMLVEKAFAKYYGSYDGLEGGQVHNAFVDLTAGFAEIFSLGEDLETVW